MCTSGEWRGGVPRSPSHESVTTDLSLFSVSSAASDAKILRLLASRAGQGPDPNLRVSSPNPEAKLLHKSLKCLSATEDSCRDVLAGCAALCASLGLRRSFSAADILPADQNVQGIKHGSSESGVLTLCVATGISNSMWAVSGGSQLPSPQRSVPPMQHVTSANNKIRQSYIKRRLLSTYRALERLSQSEFNLDKLEAAAVCAVTTAVAGPGPTVLAVPKHVPSRFMPPEAADLALTAADLERERGRPLTKYERNMMIFNWLHTLDEADAF